MSQPTRLTLRGSLEELTVVADEFDAFAAAHEVPAEVCEAMQLALEETITNIIKHGYKGQPGPIVVDMTIAGGDVVVSIADVAPAFNPFELPPPRLDAPLADKKPGGLGIHLVRSMMDDVVYERTGDGNKLTMRKRNAIA